MKYVVFYESAEDVASKAPPHFPAHRARCREFHARGALAFSAVRLGLFGLVSADSATVSRYPTQKGVGFVLTITPAAEEALDAVVAAGDAPEGAGIRITRGLGADGQPALGLMLTPEPEPGDEVVDEASVPVFLAQEVADLLDDKVLDAQVQGDEIAFQLGQQA